jgi:hypothetical protein
VAQCISQGLTCNAVNFVAKERMQFPRYTLYRNAEPRRTTLAVTDAA